MAAKEDLLLEMWNTIERGNYDRKLIIRFCNAHTIDDVLNDHDKNPRKYSIFEYTCLCKRVSIARDMCMFSKNTVAGVVYHKRFVIRRYEITEGELFGLLPELRACMAVKHMHDAANHCDYDAWKWWLPLACDLNFSVPDQTPLIYLVLKSSNDDIRFLDDLIAEGVDVSHCEKHTPPLHYYLARRNPKVEVVQRLLILGADPNTSRTPGSTPLSLTFSRYDIDVILWLLYYGADLYQIVNSVFTLMSYAHKNHVEELRRLYTSPLPLQSLTKMRLEDDKMRAHIQTIKSTYNLPYKLTPPPASKRMRLS